ncbi:MULTISPECIES: neutral zinc metallopeptidase [Kocuria]|uniref:KPN_02809 family neutral zinc metallopeptidase n=1 Tax=Kocuria TaxID=57493 RepID=UPI000DD4D4B6|nr:MULTISPECIES: neutral zinc metallopeptidase [Kocuria]MCC5671381.1 neutral zinc metallopeptidase [Kocuria rhizophila]
MSFNENSQLDAGRVRSGGGGRGIAVGGGLGGVVILLLAGLFFGQDGIDAVTGGSQAQTTGTQQVDGALAERCRTGADANSDPSCRMVATVQSLDQFWGDYYPRATGKAYTLPEVTLFRGSDSTSCGQASSATGPFYCPPDRTVYLDTAFFEQMRTDFGAGTDALAQEYVMAHEVGHHVQNLQGTLGRAQRDPNGPTSAAVRTELQADCYAGMWANHAAEPGGSVQLKPITRPELSDAIEAAGAIGDDRIQETTQGRAHPESFTHGTSAQRQAWFLTGYQTGDIRACNTFTAESLDRPAALQ